MMTTTQTAPTAPVVTIRPLDRTAPGSTGPSAPTGPTTPHTPTAHTAPHPPAAPRRAVHPQAVGAAPRAPRHPRTACALPADRPGPSPDDAAARRELARRFAQRLVEVLAGARPAGQLVRHTTHDGYRQLSGLVRRGPLRTAAGRGPLGLGPVHEFSPAPDAVEVCVRVATGRRDHVVAFRLERHHRTETWQCAAVEAR